MDFKTFVAVVVLVLGIMYLSGCSTVAGLGRDITDTADSAKVALKDYASK